MIISNNEKFIMIFRTEEDGLIGNKDYTEIFATKDIVHIEPCYEHSFRTRGEDYIERKGYYIELSNNKRIWINQSEYKKLVAMLSFNVNTIENKYFND